MNLGRIFANAIARRAAYVLVGLVCLWLGLGDAKAQSCSHSYTLNTDQCPDQGSAYAAVWAAANEQIQKFKQSNPNDTRVACFNTTTTTNVTIWIRINGCGSANHKLYTRTFPANTSCAAKPATTFSHDLRIPTGATGCNAGCEFVVTNNGDGTYTRNYSTPGLGNCQVLPDCPTDPAWYMNSVTSLCTPVQEECPGNKAKNPKTGACEEACPTGMVLDQSGACKPSADDCPAGNVRAPSGQCLPGEGQCAAGEAKRPNGTCGRDSDGDGQADEDDDDPENDPDKPTGGSAGIREKYSRIRFKFLMLWTGQPFVDIRLP